MFGNYSFQNVVASISGLGGVVILGAGAGQAEEGITVEPVADKSTMTIGADGGGMHSLSADRSSTMTVRLLKTSVVNAQLALMMSLQTETGVGHGLNTITIRDILRGDSIVGMFAAFKSWPSLTYAKDGGSNEWVFDVILTTRVLGVGTPAI